MPQKNSRIQLFMQCPADGGKRALALLEHIGAHGFGANASPAAPMNINPMQPNFGIPMGIPRVKLGLNF
jgi:hypothetical protein